MVAVGVEVCAMVGVGVIIVGAGEFLTAGFESAGVLSGSFVCKDSSVMATIVPARAWSMMGVEVGRAGRLQAASRDVSMISVIICRNVFIVQPFMSER